MPSNLIGQDFETDSMNVLDNILSNLGSHNDGLGPNWSGLERVAHSFHMWDLWMKIFNSAWKTVKANPPHKELCKCVLDVENNSIKTAVGWVANHYKSGTPITLLNRAIPKLVDATTWTVWKNRLLHYYTDEALKDAATYLLCYSINICNAFFLLSMKPNGFIVSNKCRYKVTWISNRIGEFALVCLKFSPMDYSSDFWEVEQPSHDYVANYLF
ncbi:unnamed protein product [Mytilus edulis]|uniref:Uncharacterized protein n=1 Tax=Mytilus edulis TaxID=6550 RepID=A0A8S3SR29_MYTED|nr:unnamed protein product [Mytilus edulis]